ncbi:AraC family transcriptional regulator [Paraburkholderia caffeinilytica]|uniref:AraC family transcriptional regulator n=1 Tax=Paraburkholderia caffeinilytica TaxID=1761016 RepID=UPI0038BCFF03
MKSPKIESVNPVWRQRYTIVPTPQLESVIARTWTYENGFREVWHAHEEAQLIYVTRGVLRILTPAGIWTLPPFHAMWLPAATTHELHAIGDVVVRTAYVAPDADANMQGRSRCQVLHIGELLDALVNGLTPGSQEVGDARRAELLTELFLLELARAPEVTSGTLPLPDDRRLRSICEQLLSYPENNDTIERWGERVGASPSTLGRLFRDETGLSFGQWRQQLRLVEAVARLALGVPVTVIAEELGYQSASAFIAMFRKTLGTTPQRYLNSRTEAVS